MDMMMVRNQHISNRKQKKNKPNEKDFLTPAKAKKEDIIVMKLFNKLANNNTIEDGDIENEVMHRILTAKENIELDGNKERALFLLQHGAIPTGCRLCCDSFGMIRLRSLFMVLMVMPKISTVNSHAARSLASKVNDDLKTNLYFNDL